MNNKQIINHIMLAASMVVFNSLLHAEPLFPANYHYTNSLVISGFKLTIATTNEFFTLGQPIDLTVSLQNVSTNDVMVSLGLRPFVFTLIGPDGKQVSKTEAGKQYLEPTGGSSHGIFIKAGDSFTGPWSLTGYFWMTNTGEYSVTVLRRSQGKEWLAGPLKIVITEPIKK